MWYEMIRWFSIAVMCFAVGVNIFAFVKSTRAYKMWTRKIEDEIPEWVVRNHALWSMNRKLVEYVRIKHPETYQEFEDACLTDEEKEVLQLQQEDLTSEEK